jgi:hypothetical protein
VWQLLAPTNEEKMELQKVEVQTKTMTGFATRNANKERIEKEEEELKQLSEDNKPQEAKAQDAEDFEGEEPSNPEEKSFKKRYGDLRRHTQKKELELQKQIDELRGQLEKSATKQLRMPKSSEEIAEWSKEFPDVAKIVETIAMQKAQEQSKALEERVKKLDELQADTLRQRAETELVRLHPDFDAIREQSEFHDWVEAQPKWIQNALYDNETDAISAARAIDLYKADMGINTKKAKKSDDKDAAKSVGNSRKAGFDSASEQGTIRESDVERMSSKEYEKNQEAIIAAIQSGKFVYDRTGSAR